MSNNGEVPAELMAAYDRFTRTDVEAFISARAVDQATLIESFVWTAFMRGYEAAGGKIIE